MHDLIIIGAGPAGITAAVYAARKRLKTVVITKDIGGQAALSADIENYVGFQFITGLELVGKFEEHLKGYDDVTVVENDEVTCIKRIGEIFSVKTPTSEYMAKAVIIATGRKPRLLGVPGEKEFKNRGVTYCATCDGPLFAGKDVAVIGGGNSALDATLQLINIANRVYLININKALEGDEIMIEKVKNAKNIVEILNNTETKEILGSRFVEQIRIFADKTDDRLLDVQGVFIEIGSIPVKELGECEGLQLNEYDEIIVNKRCETNIPGLFAAGDVTSVPEKQIIIAAGQGSIASLSAFKYISKKYFND